MINIGILQTGSSPFASEEGEADYPDMVINLLASVDHDIEYTIFDCREGYIPSSVDTCDGWVITGSRHSVTEELPWMLKLEAFARNAINANIPIVGICFGHQLMAKAMGGQVKPAEAGWGCGLMSYRPTEGHEGNLPHEVQLNAMHQDQVVEAPSLADVFMSSDFCPIAGLKYSEVAFSVQPHPEFTTEFTQRLVENRRGNLIPADVADSALQRTSGPTHAPLIAQLILKTFNR